MLLEHEGGYVNSKRNAGWHDITLVSLNVSMTTG